MEKRDVANYTIRSNGQMIGKVNIHLSILRNLAFATAVLVSVSLANNVEHHNYDYDTPAVKTTNKVNPDILASIAEPTYEVPYLVKFGDTLSELVHSYAPNNVEEVISQILARNKNITNRNILQQGSTIYLCSVPESYLAELGYSADYSLFDPMYEIEDRAYYVESSLENEPLDRDNQELYDVLTKKMTSLERVLKDYHIKADEELRKYLLDYILEEYRTLSQEVEKFSGQDFARHRRVYALTDAHKNINEFQSYT